MKPILFAPTATEFDNNGLGALVDAPRCIVREERNGPYELEMDYPVDGQHFSEIEHSAIIYAIPADGKGAQPFRIYEISKPFDGLCTIYAEHISYQLFHIPLNPFLPETSITRAFQAIKANAAEDCPFEFSTDKTTVANFKVDEPKSIREVLYGSEGSILDVYGGGEYEWDRYNVILHQHRGTDRGVVLRYGKDITDLTQEENIEDTITGIYPFWKGQNDEQEDVLVALPEKVVHSANAGNFPYKRTVTLDCSAEFDNVPTVAQLRTYANNYISQNNIGVPDVSITVSFAPLWQTEEYKDIANLERVNLCDTVTVHYEKLGVDATAKVIRTKYDVLNERYEEIELGSAKSSVASVIRGDIQSAIETAAKRSTEIENKLHVEITENTRKITGGLGGHVVLKLNADGEPEEILIMDTDDVTTAVNVWRFNMGGLGHSHSGYNGPFDDIALTMDGHINANMITVGTLNANLIKAGVLSDSQGINFIDMETGEMRIGASASLGGSTIAQHKAAAVSDANGYTDAQLADYKDTVDAVVSNLQSQIDGQVMTWYYDYEPTMQNKPASDWTTTALREQHEGDVFYWKTKGYAYRFMKSGSTWGWTLVQDTDITAAIAKAENAQDTADHKRRVFVTQPVPPYDIGDLWTQGSNGDLYRCETARASGSYVASDWKKATKYTDDSTFTAFRDGTYATFVTSTNSGIQSAQNTANSRITTFYQASQPTANATGDLWIDTDDGNKLYRWNGSTWKSVQDSAIQTALTNAADAQSTADSKIITFAQASQPTATDVGDLWIDTDANNKMYRWSGTQWVAYTDTSALQTWINGAYASTIQTIQGQIDGKAETYHQSADPSDNWTSSEYTAHTGDLWYDTSDGTTYYWNGAVWVSQDVPDEVFDAIDGKAQIFVSQPTTPYNVGDLWFNSATSDIMTCITARTSGNYTASDWQKRNKYTDDTAVTTLNTALNQTEIFNRLTNNGAIQGIYMQNGQLYINASYIQSGTLKLGGVNNTNGVLQVFDANGNVIGSWDKDGLAASGNFQIVDGNYKTLFDTVKYPQSRQVYGDWIWVTAKGYATKYDNSGNDVAAKYFIPRSNGGYREVAISTNISADTSGSMENSYVASTNTSFTGGYIYTWKYGISGNKPHINLQCQNLTTVSDMFSLYDLNPYGFLIGGGGFVLECRKPSNSSQATFSVKYGSQTIVSHTATISSSSKRYKHNIRPLSAERDAHKLLSLPIVEFEWNDDHVPDYEDMRGQTIPGIIAEDVEEVYPSATIHDAEGRVESWDERRLIPGMLALIQEQDKKIKQLEARLAKIEEMLK